MMERRLGMVHDWEWVAGWVLERASGDAWSIARGLGIEVQSVPNMRANGALAEYNGKTLIGVRKSLPRPYAAHTIAHEIGHWALRQVGSEDSEKAADYIAAAILMPHALFLARIREVGADPVKLALPFGVTETSAVLRIGETQQRPLAVVAPTAVRVRGPDEWVWPEESIIRRWAKRGGPPLTKVRFIDDPRRVALLAIEG